MFRIGHGLRGSVRGSGGSGHYLSSVLSVGSGQIYAHVILNNSAGCNTIQVTMRSTELSQVTDKQNITDFNFSTTLLATTNSQVYSLFKQDCLLTRDCVSFDRRGHFRSHDKDGGHTIRSDIAENPMLHVNSTVSSSTG